ncbi:hypothetical protein [Mycobacterium sp. SMC-4]|uniref:hypothetical protein n=1 Tax=Mycobacterium sp. SMC-4 TaxID=2857059 RepID=UPI0021B1D96E|nr:hypothetical protein [Mycobacterium sp. SMC-4]UXA19332.1 hypothetical protein KXD98_06875 [Mycobacterium sp. SMC-4]
MALVVGLLVWQGRAADSPSVADDGLDRTVGLLTEKDPVCDDWIRYANELAAATEEWSAIDKTISAGRWTPEQRAVVERAAEAMALAANQFESILPTARNVVLQELIAQSIVFWRKFVDRVPIYARADSVIAGVAGNFGSATTFMCTAAPIVLARNFTNETATSSAEHPGDLTPFISATDGVCQEFVALLDRQNRVLRGWASGNPAVPAADWTADERKLNEAAIPVLEADALQARMMAEGTDNYILSDLLTTYRAYLRAFTQALPEYEPDDGQLWKVATFLGGGIGAACRAPL